MTRQAILAESDHAIEFDLPTALLTGETITVTFPAAFTGTAATTSADWVFAGNVATYTAPADQAAGASYALDVTGLINPAVVGNQVIDITSTNGDFGEITVPIVADDQIVVTAKVDQVLFFDVRDGSGVANTATDNAVQFGSLTAGAERYGTDAGLGGTTDAPASQFEIGTNATNGYFVDVTGDTLRSMEDDTVTIDALDDAAPAVGPQAAPAAGTEAFGIKAALTTASAPTAADLASNPALVSGVVAPDFLTQFNHPGAAATAGAATPVELIASNVGPSTNELYDISYIANISPLTEAGNYTTTFTFTATARF